MRAVITTLLLSLIFFTCKSQVRRDTINYIPLSFQRSTAINAEEHLNDTLKVLISTIHACLSDDVKLRERNDFFIKQFSVCITIDKLGNIDTIMLFDNVSNNESKRRFQSCDFADKAKFVQFVQQRKWRDMALIFPFTILYESAASRNVSFLELNDYANKYLKKSLSFQAVEWEKVHTLIFEPTIFSIGNTIR